MVKEEKVFTISDGRQFKTRKAAERNENILTMANAGYTEEEVVELLKEITLESTPISNMLKSFEDWRDMPAHWVEDLPRVFKDFKQDIVTYMLVEVNWWGRDNKKELKTVRAPRLPKDEVPEEISSFVKEMSEESQAKDGATYTVEPYEAKERTIKFKLVRHELSPEEKMKRGIELSEGDIRDFVNERTVIYEDEGEESRWTKAMTTVVKGEDGYNYVIHWDRGLTESQEDEYYYQPEKVELREKEVTTVVTEIIYLDKEEK